MGTTSPYGFPYPELSDAPNVPQDVQDLAVAVNDEIDRVDDDIAANTAVTAAFATGATQTTAQNTSGTTTSAAFTATLTGGTTCSFTFVAPPSGKVQVFNTATMENNTTAFSAVMDFELRTGGVVGSGTVIHAATDDTSNSIGGAQNALVSKTVEAVITGLTSGSTYNIRQMFRSSSGTSTFQRKRLTVVPLFF